jgi:SAM-dependent methyltransferase
MLSRVDAELRHRETEVMPGVACVACASDDVAPAESWRQYVLATCRSCGMTFTVNHDYSADRYVAAYDDDADRSPVPSERTYVYTLPEQRLEWERGAFQWLLPPPRLTRAEAIACKLLARHAPSGAVVVDCGCGTGRFLRALKCAGISAVGVELSERLVATLRAAGIPANHGSAPDFPWDGPEPFAITFFEVLEHLPDPGAVVRVLRDRFPSAWILASVPSPTRARLLLGATREPTDYPPNHFLRWTPEALRRFFGLMGYQDVQVVVPGPVGSELVPGLAQVLSKVQRPMSKRGGVGGRIGPSLGPAAAPSRVAATVLLGALKGYQVAGDLLGLPRMLRARRLGASADSMLVVARGRP